MTEVSIRNLLNCRNWINSNRECIGCSLTAIGHWSNSNLCRYRNIAVVGGGKRIVTGTSICS